MVETSDSAVVVVTGANRGIGRAIAGRMAALGHRLVLTARDAARLEVVAAELRAEARCGGIATVATDLRATHGVEDVLEACNRAFTAPDVIISNAGTAPSDKVENTTTEMLQEAFDLHVGAPLAFARAIAPVMKQRGRGCLVHLASTAGLRGYPFTSAYTAAKHGMVGLSRALHAELSPKGVQVYAVCPGFVDTDITRSAAAAVAAKGRTTADEALARMGSQNVIGRMHTADEVAAAVAMLVHERPRGCVYDLDRASPTFLDP